jgi:hypothetical protein
MIWIPIHIEIFAWTHPQKTNVDSEHYFLVHFAGSKDDVDEEDVGSRGGGGIGGRATLKMLRHKSKT